MISAIAGDTIGSIYEWNNIKTKDFEFFHEKCEFTDDTILTVAVGKAILENKRNGVDLAKATAEAFREAGAEYPYADYGCGFRSWLFGCSGDGPYNSCGNGAAMRVSACGYAASSIGEVVKMSSAVTGVTHNHPEGLKGAEATAVAVFMARNRISMAILRDYIVKHYYAIDFTLNEIRPSYSYEDTCQNTVPQALEAFFESTSYEDAIRNAISIGGDSDTLAAITGSVAEAYYGVPKWMKEKARTYLDEYLLSALDEFEAQYPSRENAVESAWGCCADGR